MSAGKSSGKKPSSSAILIPKSDKRKREDDFLPDLSDDVKGLVSAIHHMREKAQKDDQRKQEQTITSLSTEVKSMFEELKAKVEKDRQNFAKAVAKNSKECENALKKEISKLQVIYEKFTKEKEAHVQSLKDAISRYEEETDGLLIRYEQKRKKEKSMILEKEKASADKIAELEQSLKKKKQDNRTFSILRKTLGSFLENGSDEDFPSDD